MAGARRAPSRPRLGPPVRRPLVLGLLAACAVASPAAGKGLDLSLRSDDVQPRVGEQVRISLRAVADEPVTVPCSMRIVVVSPGVGVRRALRSLEGRPEPQRIGSWGAFRLASLRSTGELEWQGRLRPNRPGRWTLVVPNWCAEGYVLPEGVKRLHLDVRPAE